MTTVHTAHVREGWGISPCLETGSNFTILDVGLHYHPHIPHGSLVERKDACHFRIGFYITIFNFTVKVGKFWDITLGNKKEKLDEDDITF